MSTSDSDSPATELSRRDSLANRIVKRTPRRSALKSTLSNSPRPAPRHPAETQHTLLSFHSLSIVIAVVSFLAYAVSVHKRINNLEEYLRSVSAPKTYRRSGIDPDLTYYAYDSLAKADYAASPGGHVVRAFTSSGSQKRMPDGSVHESQPEAVIQPFALRYGNCWKFNGSTAQVSLKLARLLSVTEVVVEHVPLAVSLGDVINAPKDVEVWGVLEGANNTKAARAHVADAPDQSTGQIPSFFPPSTEFILLTRFSYDFFGNPIQIFPINQSIVDLGLDFGVLVFVIKSSWGARNTCVYRLRVHGNAVDWFEA